MAIEYRLKNGIEYALISKSVRDGSRVGKEPRTNLGRVIDKNKGIYRNRERGIFMYDPVSDTYSSVPADFVEPGFKRKSKFSASSNNGSAYMPRVSLPHVRHASQSKPSSSGLPE